MRRGIAVALLIAAAVPARADDYKVDPAHTAVTFRISHLGLSWTYGRFNVVSGDFSINKETPAMSSFALTIEAESLDTGNTARDKHLKSPDFLNVKQFPLITFKSKSVKAVEGGYEVTGDFSLHGKTNPISFTLKGGQEAEFPKGTKRTGFSTELVVKRSEFGVTAFKQAVGDEIYIAISFEGTRK